MNPTSDKIPGKHTNPLVIILATIGGITLLTTMLIFGLAGFIMKNVISSDSTPIADNSSNCIGIVNIRGVIADSEQIIKELEQFRREQRVKAIVVRIDSPGGAVGASQELFQELSRVDSIKPVVVSMGSLAASGGYYTALGARTIVANPGTVTGSIGVIMKIPNLEKLMQKVGIGTTVIKSGKLKDLGSVSRELTPEERDILQNVMNDIHNQFISDVAESRNLPVEKVAKLADGRIFSGRQARELGLIDKLGNFQTAVDSAAEAAAIEGEPRLIYPEKDKIKLIRQILEDGGASTIARGIREAVQGGNGMDMVSLH